MGTELLPAKTDKKIEEALRKILPRAFELARAIHQHPETGFEERFAASALTEFLGDYGFRISRGAAGIETAFVAEKRSKARPCVAFLAEMDALPGMGHACGHNLIAASSAGAGAVLSIAFPTVPGSIKVIGCPAEEGGGGKLLLADAGTFKGIDAALIAHPDRRTEVYKRSLGVAQIELVFSGRAAHASAFPEDGINALDAVIQTFNAVAMLRQKLPDRTRVHGIITDGGQAANIIPARAAAMFLARGLTLSKTMDITERVIACARGAAMATGAKLRVKVLKDKIYAPYVPNRALGEVFREDLERSGCRNEQGPEDEGMGSTDVGNVCLHAPVLHPLIGIPGVKAGVHTPEFAAAAVGPGARRMLEYAIVSLARTASRVLVDAALRAEIQKEHRESVKAQGPMPTRWK